MRSVLAGSAPAIAPLAGAVGLSLGYIAVSGYLFGRVYRYAVRTGLLARYSAETVS
jgi:ABC-2 type transport system permease protein